MGSKGRRLRTRTPQIEPLAARLLFTVEVSGNYLSITGTPADDRIGIAADPLFINAMIVDDNGTVHRYSLSAFWMVTIDTGDGNDRITLDSSLDGVSSIGMSHIDAGAGDDRIRCGTTNDTILAGAGRDRILSGPGDDSIVCGSGADRVDAGPNNDTVTDSSGAGEIHGGDGNDLIKVSGAATVFGDDGDDTLVATYISAGAGDDTCYGTNANDTIYAGEGYDVIKGWGGDDLLDGGSEDDAIFGGAGNDTIHAGDGDDNLYNGDGSTDRNNQDDGRDLAFGQAGADWFQSAYWTSTDRNAADAESGYGTGGQNFTSDDPAFHGYTPPPYGDNDFESDTPLYAATGDITPGAIQTLPVGNAALVSSGGWDPQQQKFVPAPLSAANRAILRPSVLRISEQWTLGEMITAKDDIVWFRVTGDNPKTATAKVVAPSLSGNVYLPADTPGLRDLVHSEIVSSPDGDDLYGFRFLAVKKGTILVHKGSSSGAYPFMYKSLPLELTRFAPIRIPAQGDVMVVGTAVRHLASEFNITLTRTPRGFKGILTAEGPIWLLLDGSAAFLG